MEVPALLEFIVIISVIFLVALIIRVIRVRPGVARKNAGAVGEIPVPADPKAGKMQRRLTVWGLALVLVGLVFLSAGLRLFKWVFWSYSWAVILLVAGIVLFFLARKK